MVFLKEGGVLSGSHQLVWRYSSKELDGIVACGFPEEAVGILEQVARLDMPAPP
jgi:hypothetical protein